MTKKKLIIWIPLAALLVNGLIDFIVTNARSPEQAGSVVSGARPPVDPVRPSNREAASNRETLAHDRQPQQDDTHQESEHESKERQDEKNALARRAIGLAALEAGDYDKALINFTEARALLGDKAQVGDLLRVTEELRGRPQASSHRFSKGSPAPSSSSASGSSSSSPLAAAAPAPRPVTRAAPLRRVAVKETSPPIEVSAPPEAPASGTLIVTTTPRGLLVQVDEAPIDSDADAHQGQSRVAPHRAARRGPQAVRRGLRRQGRGDRHGAEGFVGRGRSQREADSRRPRPRRPAV